ncbi:hypothetical protein EI94DRAFT_1809337 [Lactarius quietus]|nr:hypothetical protein EI94DRAFT_1809337 [Lactarius quietus]
MVYRKNKKAALEYTARTQLAEYLQSIGDVPVTANAWAAALHKHAHEHWESQNGQRVDHLQLASQASPTQSSSGESGPSEDAGPSESGTPEDPHLGDNNLHFPSPEPTPSRPTDDDHTPVASGSGQATAAEQTTGSEPARDREDIQPDPLADDTTEDDPAVVIPLLKLKATQDFIDTLKVASLETSGMQQDDIDSICDHSPVLDLEDPSPLLRLLRHFINNAGSSQAHYNGIWAIELHNNPLDDFLSFDQAKCHIWWLSGVVPIEHDMCPNTCAAYILDLMGS